MERRYDILFSISLRHQFFDGERTRGLRIRPTTECRKHLARHNLLFKEYESGAWIIVEKIRDANGVLSPTRPLQTTVGFSFLIENSAAELLTFTEPVGRNTYQSKIAGRDSVAFYFDNLDTDRFISPTLELAADGIGSSDEDVFFLYPGVFSLPVSQVSKLRAQLLAPHAPVRDFLPDPPSARNIEAVLDQGAYLLEVASNGAPSVMERSLVYREFERGDAIGMVGIYKDETVDYGQAMDYTITLNKCM